MALFKKKKPDFVPSGVDTTANAAVTPDKALDASMRTALAGVTQEDWNWISIGNDKGVLLVTSGENSPIRKPPQ